MLYFTGLCSDFQVLYLKIEHIVADPHSQQTLGKIDRFHQTIQRQMLDKSYDVM
jgi:hypothetical protein